MRNDLAYGTLMGHDILQAVAIQLKLISSGPVI